MLKVQIYTALVQSYAAEKDATLCISYLYRVNKAPFWFHILGSIKISKYPLTKYCWDIGIFYKKT